MTPTTSPSLATTCSKPIASGRCAAPNTAAPFWSRRRFGAAASVWNFNRAADAVQLIVRALVLLMGGHYVDDSNGSDFEALADSALFRRRPRRHRPPNQAIQGAAAGQVASHSGGTDRPRRRHRAPPPGRQAGLLDPGRPWRRRAGGLAPTVLPGQSQRLGGCSAEAIFARCPAVVQGPPQNMQPRRVPFGPPTTVQATIFADAFFQEGEERVKAGHVCNYAGRRANSRRRNGWGYVVHIGAESFFDFGEAPAWFWTSSPSGRPSYTLWRDIGADPGHRHYGPLTAAALDGAHRQHRRTVRPEQGLRKDGPSQRHGSSAGGPARHGRRTLTGSRPKTTSPMPFPDRTRPRQIAWAGPECIRRRQTSSRCSPRWRRTSSLPQWKRRRRFWTSPGECRRFRECGGAGRGAGCGPDDAMRRDAKEGILPPNLSSPCHFVRRFDVAHACM